MIVRYDRLRQRHPVHFSSSSQGLGGRTHHQVPRSSVVFHVVGPWTRTTFWTLPPPLLPTGRLGPPLLLLCRRLGLSSLFCPRWFCGFCPCVALPLRSGIFMMPPLMRMGGSWLRLRRFSPTMAIRSFTTPVQIWRPIVSPGVWFCPSSLSIACRIISFLRDWSFLRVSLLPRPPTRGRRFWQRTSHLPLRQPLCLICLTDSGLLRRRPFPLWGVPRVSLGGVPCAPPPPITLLS